MKNLKSNRRTFLKQSSLATLGFTVLPSYLALGKTDSQGNVPPSKRVNMAFIGLGMRAKISMPIFAETGVMTPVAFCDVDFKHKHTPKDFMAQYPSAKHFADFRVMLDKMGDDIDAVNIMTPDHWHYVMAIEAMRRGKHVYLEKPLGHTFVECEKLMEAEKKYGVVTQMGNQGHTSAGSYQWKQLQQEGVFDDVVEVQAYKTIAKYWWQRSKNRVPLAETKMPATLDYDAWCGPAEKMVFDKRIHPFNWRGFHRYGSGVFGDLGAHLLSFVHEGLELGLPTRVEAVENAEFDASQTFFPMRSELNMHFPERGDTLPAVKLNWKEGAYPAPSVSEKYWDKDSKGNPRAPQVGTQGTILYRKQEDYITVRGTHETPSRLYPRAEMMKVADAVKAPKIPYGHLESFLRACLGETKTTSPFSVGAPMSQVLSLGMIAQRLNQNFSFDPKTKRITDNKEADALLHGDPLRPGFEDYYENV